MPSSPAGKHQLRSGAVTVGVAPTAHQNNQRTSFVSPDIQREKALPRLVFSTIWKPVPCPGRSRGCTPSVRQVGRHTDSACLLTA
eukprot:COSAG01_NODE_1168_length_11426_cov_339.595038_15_plen_85_part_00